MRIFRKGERLLDAGMILILIGLVLMASEVLGLLTIKEGVQFSSYLLTLLGLTIIILAKHQKLKKANKFTNEK